MAYEFSNQVLSKAKITDETNETFTINGIAARTQDADMIMGGLSYLLDIVGWKTQDVTRIVNQDVVEKE